LKFGLVKPRERCLEIVDVADLDAARAMINLDRGACDHAMIDRYTAIVVYEFGLFEPTHQDHYAIKGRLYAGASVIYAVDERGATINLEPPAWSPVFFASVAEAEQAIADGAVKRPAIAVNDVVMWCWPDPPPAQFARIMEAKHARTRTR